MSTELAYLVGVARKQAWTPPAGSELTYQAQTLGVTTDGPSPPMTTYIGAAVTVDTSAQADFTSHEYQKNYQARNYERASIEALNNRDAKRSTEHFMQRLAVGVRPRVRELHDRIIAGRGLERVQYVMQDEPTYYTWDGTDPTLAMFSASQAAINAWADARSAARDDETDHIMARSVRESVRQSRGPW